MSSSAPDQKRLVSLDLFRGMSIAGMILVNNQGDWGHVYPMLRHAFWHGWSGADMVFPFFLFAVGASLFFSHSSHMQQGASKHSILLKATRRSILLIVLGLFLNLFPFFSISQVRIPGVLQRIGLCYFFASVLFLYTPKRIQAGLAVILLVLYGALLLFVTPDGFGHGSLEPCCNLPGYVDHAIFPGGHTYEHAPAPGFDPEGLIGSMSAIVSVMIGVFAASRVREGGLNVNNCIVLFCWGAGLIGLGLVLNEIIPINKNLWTPGYSLFMGGMALIFFSFLYWIYDLREHRFITLPFLALGRNAIAVYLLSSLAGKGMISLTMAGESGPVPLKTFLHKTFFLSWFDPMAASCIYAMAFLCVWTGVMIFLYRKRLFISI